MSNFSEERLAICNSCIYNESGDCIICGCDLSLKTLDPNESCPLSPGSKWGVYTEPIQETLPITMTPEAPVAPAVPPPRPPCQSCTKRR